MTENLEQHKDPFREPYRELADAINLKSDDSVLFVGVGQRLSDSRGEGDFRDLAGSVKFVRTAAEVEKLIIKDEKFDKVVIGYGNILDCAQLVKASTTRKTGLLAHLNQNPDDEDRMDRIFNRFVDQSYLHVRTWTTRVGGSLLNIAEVSGIPLSVTNGQI